MEFGAVVRSAHQARRAAHFVVRVAVYEGGEHGHVGSVEVSQHFFNHMVDKRFADRRVYNIYIPLPCFLAQCIDHKQKNIQAGHLPDIDPN